MAPTQCPACAHPCDAATGGADAPVAGDFTVCLRCATILRFVERDGRLDVAALDQVELAQLDVETFAELERVRRAITARRPS